MSSKLCHKASSWKNSFLNCWSSQGHGSASLFEYSCSSSSRPNHISAFQKSPTVAVSRHMSLLGTIQSTRDSDVINRRFSSYKSEPRSSRSLFKFNDIDACGTDTDFNQTRGIKTWSRTQQSDSSKVTNSESKSPDSPNILSAMLQENPKDILEKPEAEKEESDESKSEKEKKNEDDTTESAFLRSQRYAKWMLLVSFGISAPMGILEYGKPKVTEDGEILRDQYSAMIAPAAYIARAWGEVMNVKREIVEPISTKLLPDPLKEPYYQPPYTLVIELMDVFLRPVYDSVTGWRFKKRPGIDYFLSQVTHPLYEIVIFTRETGPTAWPLIDSMDSKGYIMYRLFRDSARYKSGFSFGNILEGELPRVAPYYQKDLSFLNRDLSKVIIVDCDKKAYENNPDNGLYIEKWDGSSSDSALYDLATLLRTIATSNTEDVRPILRHYAKHDDPLQAFKEAQLKAQEDIKLMKDTKPKVQFSSTLSSFFGKR